MFGVWGLGFGVLRARKCRDKTEKRSGTAAMIAGVSNLKCCAIDC